MSLKSTEEDTHRQLSPVTGVGDSFNTESIIGKRPWQMTPIGAARACDSTADWLKETKFFVITFFCKGAIR